MEAAAPRARWARTVDGAYIAYKDVGEGPITLVLINGWVSHLEVYWEQPLYVRFLRRLSRNMRVLVFDKCGIGMSDRVGEGAPDLGILADDVRAVMDAAGSRRRSCWRMEAPVRSWPRSSPQRIQSERSAWRTSGDSTGDRSPTTRGGIQRRRSQRTSPISMSLAVRSTRGSS